MRQRNAAIDIMKCLAAIIITNSHMELLYGSYSYLATGGAIGDALFFFCSGFTLFLGRMGRFDNWYKRRINRIYPTVFAWSIVAAVVFGIDMPIDEIIISGGGWFVSCIMIYYLILYLVHRYLINKMFYVLAAVFVGCVIYSFSANFPAGFGIYGATYFKWVHYFLFMLVGAMMGLSYKREREEHTALNVVKLIGCIVLFYAIYIIGLRGDGNASIQIWSLVPLSGVVFYMYKVCNCTTLKRLMFKRITGWGISFIGGLCLEIYLVQYSLFTDMMNSLFPLNLLIMFLIILVVAYLVRCLSRIFSQTFKDGEYDWKGVFRAV